MSTIFSSALQCCGIKEAVGVHGISIGAPGSHGPAKFIRAFANNRFNSSWPTDKNCYYVFSYNHNHYEKGDALVKYIRDHKLGEVLETGSHKNKNSGNNLKACLWVVDDDKLKQWWQADNRRVFLFR